VRVGYEWAELGLVTDPFDFAALDLALRHVGVGSSTSGFRGWSGSDQAVCPSGNPACPCYRIRAPPV
jgi:hypothetical protein